MWPFDYFKNKREREARSAEVLRQRVQDMREDQARRAAEADRLRAAQNKRYAERREAVHADPGQHSDDALGYLVQAMASSTPHPASTRPTGPDERVCGAAGFDLPYGGRDYSTSDSFGGGSSSSPSSSDSSSSSSSDSDPCGGSD